MVGLAIVLVAGMALWRRQDLYLISQWIIRYPERGLVYLLLQIVVPSGLAVVGVALVLYPIAAW
jgi:hypothetical protein